MEPTNEKFPHDAVGNPEVSATEPPVMSAASPQPSAAKEAAKEAGQKFLAALKPWADLAWLHLRVWTPFLANPKFRARQVQYGGREFREGGVWKIALPQQCCQCGSTEGLMRRTYEKSVRGFETPAMIVSVSLGAALFLFLLGLVIGWFFNFFLAAIIAVGCGAAVLFIKSWTEHVAIAIAACPAHIGSLKCPELVASENDLYVIAPTAELAEAARAEVTARRRGGQKYASDEAPPSRPAPSSLRMEPEAAPASDRDKFRRQELPPIKLDEEFPPIKLDE